MKRNSLLLAALCALSAPALAETLDAAWAAALSSHRQIEAAGAMQEAAEYELDEARGGRLPQLGVTSDYSWLDTAPGFALGPVTTDPIFDGDDFLSAGAQVRVPLYLGGGLAARIDAAEFNASAAEGQLASVVQDIKLGVAEHYVGVLRAERAVAVSRSYVASLQTHTENARKRYELGDVPQNDYLAASVTLADAEQDLLQAENALDYARAAYNRFLGRPLDDTVSLDPALGIEGFVPAGASIERLIEDAHVNRTDLEALDAQAEALRSRADGARAAARPQLALTGGYMYLENEFLTDDEFWMAGISFNWNLFDGRQSRRQSDALNRKAAALDHHRADLQSMIDLEVRRAWNDRIEAESRVRVAGTAVERASENLRVVRNRYEAGASTNAEVLDAEALREQSMSNLDNARFGVALATFRLARAVGTL